MSTERDEEFIGMGYVNVTGMICRSHGVDFIVPGGEDYSDKKCLVGADFIFHFDREGYKTWYKRVNLSDGEFRSSLFLVDDLSVFGDESEFSVNVRQTAFAYPFSFDEDEFRIREMSCGYEFDRTGDEISCELAYMIISGNIASITDELIKFLLNVDDLSLKPLPDVNITRRFGVSFAVNNPIDFTNLRHAYMFMVLYAQRNFKFPEGITLKGFKSMVLR